MDQDNPVIRRLFPREFLTHEMNDLELRMVMPNLRTRSVPERKPVREAFPPADRPTASSIEVFRLSIKTMDLILFVKEGVPVGISMPDTLSFQEGELPDVCDLIKEITQGVFSGSLSYVGPLPEKCSRFMKEVLEAVRRIPRGEVRTYEDIAKTIGRPKGARAVGQALSKNPIPLFIPCHRIVGKGNRLTGYSLGGIDIKRALLIEERERTVL
jgi:methylated-DNA-[protein]-cysteine S-methyltransferase